MSDAATASVPRTAPVPVRGEEPQARRTHPKTFAVKAVEYLKQLALPLLAAGYTMTDGGRVPAAVIALFAGGLIVLNIVLSYVAWLRLTYTVGAEDIRVESGIFNRTARSVPFERIQDVSLEQKLVPRLFGLTAVKFETGAGKGEDLDLSYLEAEEAERLRDLVRERRDGAVAATGEAEPSSEPGEGQTVFAMDPRRVLTFGLFEFSLVIVALLFGFVQQFDGLLPFDPYDLDWWQEQLAGPGAWLAGLGAATQVIGAILATAMLAVAGVVTGVVKTALREWDFRLDRTPRGFRRRRGLLSRTDMVMPIDRVQAVKVTTGAIRRVFGWHGLSFVSLAGDGNSANHDAAPFARLDEIDPIVADARFALPGEQLDWRRGSRRHRIDSMLLGGGFFLIATIVTAIVAPWYWALVPFALLTLTILSDWLGWSRRRHALDAGQFYSRSGVLSPKLTIGNRIKLQSAEVKRGPLARLRGYASLHLGLAGGRLALHGLPVERAYELRAALVDSMSAHDFSELDDVHALSGSHSGFSANLSAT